VPFHATAAPPPPAVPSLPPSPPPPSPPRQTTFTSQLSHSTYTLHPQKLIFNEASDTCAAAGGYLVYFPSLAVQQQVEAFYTTQGFLAGASGENFYWIGARVAFLDVWPTFTWLTGRPVNGSSYVHWGYLYRPGSHPEPNNVFPPEDCAGANASVAWGGAWGWADARCTLRAPFICELPPPGPPPPSPAPPADVYVYSNETLGSATGGSTYLYSTDVRDFDGAQEYCTAQAAGASLVQYSSLEEQREVEGGFLDQQAIPPDYYPFYWIGLRVRDVWPAFQWLQPSSEWQARC
jgi:hypothetical protein